MMVFERPEVLQYFVKALRGNHRTGDCRGKNLYLAGALAGNHLGDRSRNGRPSPMSRLESRCDLLLGTPL